MSALTDRMRSYAAYHRSPWNKATHFVGVPIVVFSIFVPLAWFRFHPVAVPLTAATLFYAGVFIHYWRLDWGVALMQLPFSFGLLYAADRVSLWPFADSALAAAGAFVAGWAIQLLGHVFEGRAPALKDNILQIFNAPLFLAVEVMIWLGWRKDLKRQLS